MRFPIDVVFLDDEDRVIDVAAGLPPWRFAGRRGSRSVIELAAGEAARRGLEAGTTIAYEQDGIAPPASSRRRLSPTTTRQGGERGDAATPVPEGGNT
jgi:uncharacterized protein DUF192 probably involved in sugar metabolism